MQLPISHYTH